MLELQQLQTLIGLIRDRTTRLRADDGYSTEAVIVIALLVALALTAIGIIAAKVLSKAHNISTGG